MAKLRWKDCIRAVVNSCYRATTVLRVGNNKLYENRETVSDFNCQTAKGPTMEEEEERVADYIVGITKVSKPLPSDHLELQQQQRRWRPSFECYIFGVIYYTDGRTELFAEIAMKEDTPSLPSSVIHHRLSFCGKFPFPNR